MTDPTLLEDPSSIAPVAERCRYPSKFCRNKRSVKRNGELHRFCDHHRNKANLNQKRWSKSHRGGASSLVSPVSSTTPTTPTTSESDSDTSSEPSWAAALEGAPSFTSMLTTFSPFPAPLPSKPEMAVEDEQLHELLSELLVPRADTSATYSLDAFGVHHDQFATLVEL